MIKNGSPKSRASVPLNNEGYKNYFVFIGSLKFTRKKCLNTFEKVTEKTEHFKKSSFIVVDLRRPVMCVRRILGMAGMFSLLHKRTHSAR
jgi:hypothetical protein